MLLTLLLIFVGFVILGVGAEMLVSGASRVALRLGMAPLIVGLTIVAFGTSAPELAVSIDATLAGISGLALGNVVGSNIANIGLILGITALIQPIRIERSLVRRQIPVVIISSVLMGLMFLDGEMGRVDGAILLLGLVAYLIASYRQARLDPDANDPVLVPALGTRRSVRNKQSGFGYVNLLLIIAGLVLLITGSRVFVNNAVILARLMNINEALIGLTLVAVGTSIPELATSVIAALRKQSDIAIGNVIGSNTFNILCVLGATAMVGTIFSSQFSLVDFGVMLSFALLLLPLAWTGLVLNRIEGALLLLGYLAYITWLGSTTGSM